MGLLEGDANQNWETQIRRVFNAGAGPDRSPLISNLNIHSRYGYNISIYARLSRSKCAHVLEPCSDGARFGRPTTSPNSVQQ